MKLVIANPRILIIAERLRDYQMQKNYATASFSLLNSPV